MSTLVNAAVARCGRIHSWLHKSREKKEQDRSSTILQAGISKWIKFPQRKKKSEEKKNTTSCPLVTAALHGGGKSIASSSLTQANFVSSLSIHLALPTSASFYMSDPSQSGFSGFLSTPSHDVLTPDPVHPRSSWGEPRYFRLSSSTLTFMISWSSCQEPVVFLVAFKCPVLVFWQVRCSSCRPVVYKF